MKIGITTASGRLGLAVLRRTIERVGTDQVVAIARSPEKIPNLGVETRKGEFDDREGLKSAFQGLERLLLISSNSHPDVRLKQHTNVIDAAVAVGVKTVVFSGILTQGKSQGFQPIQQVAIDTENYLSQSGLQWAAGRNGIYIEPDLEYVQTYVQLGKITNCAGDSPCAYTSRDELAISFTHLLTQDHLTGRTYTLVGEGITQPQLCELINTNFHTHLIYEPMSVDAYTQDRVAAIGDLYGHAIAGIYESIRDGDFNPPSDYETVVGRPHKTPQQMVEDFLAGS